ncbi:MAG TPA: hypothetical protein VGP68_00240 [Gemmataceae bacterium]|nr:hypothetical protein [Gemmataceae bacterium]
MSAIEHVDTLLRESCGPVPSSAAWDGLVHFLSAHFPADAHAVLALRVSGFLEGLDTRDRLPTLDTLAIFIRTSPWRQSLLHLFADSKSVIGRALALLIAMPEDFGELADRPLLRSLLVLGALPAKIQAAALAHIIATFGATKDVEDLLDAYLQVRSVSRRRRRLNRLNKLLPDSDFLADRIRQLEGEIQIACPRCQARLGRPAMIRHLLTKHGLVLQGKRVRNAWRIVDQWLTNYRQTRDKQWLGRAFDLVAQLEDPIGPRHLQQHMVLQKVAKNAMLRRLLIAARANQTALCPFCYAQASVPVSRMLEPVPQSHGLLSRQGYRVHVQDNRPVPHLVIETPEGMIFSGREPGRWFTRQGIILLAACPLALLAVLLACVGAPTIPIIAALVLAGAAYGWSWVRELQTADAPHRAIDEAWTTLCPRLLARGPRAADAEFLAALALASVGMGSPERRAYWLDQFRQERSQALAGGLAPCTHLACLTRLTIADAASQEVDLASLTASALNRCWKAQMPLSFAQQLLDDWRTALWTRGAMARLRILLFDQAFAEGWEISSLGRLRREAPALAAVLELDDRKRTAELRWLWSSRASAPWLNIGPSHTCFELAQHGPANHPLFEKHPDLLFVETQQDGLIVCSSGVYWQHLHFPETPRQVRITERISDDRRSYTLYVAGESVHVRYDPSALVERLDRWLTYLRDDFQVRAKQARKWRSPEGTEFLPPGELAVCPECHNHFVGVNGQLGFKVAVL